VWKVWLIEGEGCVFCVRSKGRECEWGLGSAPAWGVVPCIYIENQSWGLFYGSLEQIGRAICTKFLKGPIVDRDNN
jgi:hypothetical protein